MFCGESKTWKTKKRDFVALVLLIIQRYAYQYQYGALMNPI